MMPNKEVLKSDSVDCDSYWSKELIDVVLRRQGILRKISEKDRLERIQECLYEGAKINTIDQDGNTALHIAVERGYLKIVRFLVEQKAGTDIRNLKGHTALMVAEVRRNKDVLNVFRELSNRGSQLPSEQMASTSRSTSFSDKRACTPMDNQTVLEYGETSFKRRTIADNEDYEYGKKRQRRVRTAEESENESSSEEAVQSQDETDERMINVGQNSLPFGRNNEYAATQGPKNSFHGFMYQVKLLMLFVKRGLLASCLFRLATEMYKAYKFDDLVFQYKIVPEGETFYRFLQAKHRQDETIKINAKDLLDENDKAPFGLQKYFISYRKMKRNLDIKRDLELNRSTVKDFIIFTNIDFDLESMISRKISIYEVDDPDIFLDFKDTRKQAIRYKFIAERQSELHEKLRQSTDIYRLAKILVEHVYKSKNITLKNDLFKLYHIALAIEVIDIEKKRFRGDFVEGKNLSRAGEKFREIFHAEVEKKKLQKQRKDEFPLGNAIWNELRDKPLDISSKFGNRFKPCDDPRLNHLEKFSEVFVKLINNADNNNLVTVNGQKYRKNATKESSIIFGNNIEKLAGHVLIMKDEEITFNPEFFHQTNLPGNLKDFREQLKARLGIKYEDLDKYRFKMPAFFKTCEIELLYAKLELPEDMVNDDEIDDFFHKLIFAVNQPDENELGDILIEEIGADSQFNSSDADFLGAAFEKELLNWFKKKGKEKGKEGTWYSNENAQVFFESLKVRSEQPRVYGTEHSV